MNMSILLVRSMSGSMTPTLDVDYMGNPKQEDLQKVVDRLGLDNYQMSTLFQILHDVCRNVPSKFFGK